MRKWVGRILLTVGVALLIYVGYLFYDFYYGSKYKLEEVESYLEEYGNGELVDKFMNRKDFSIELGEVYALLEIPSIELKLPIIYGIDLEHLRHGVGHDPNSAFPGDGMQTFLSAHNDAAFLRIGELDEGDEIIVTTQYGRYSYDVKKYETGHESETWRVGNEEYEELVLMTCYPFFTLWATPERYFVYAEPNF